MGPLAGRAAVGDFGSAVLPAGRRPDPPRQRPADYKTIELPVLTGIQLDPKNVRLETASIPGGWPLARALALTSAACHLWRSATTCRSR
jgi:hypothetical protein